MNRLALLMTLFVLIAPTGCAQQKVIVDTKGVNMQQYEQDLSECREYAKQVDSKVGAGAVVGAVIGGGIGAVLDGSTGAAKGAGVGAITGTAKGASGTQQEKNKVVKNCMRGRGYKVLN